MLFNHVNLVCLNFYTFLMGFSLLQAVMARPSVEISVKALVVNLFQWLCLLFVTFPTNCVKKVRTGCQQFHHQPWHNTSHQQSGTGGDTSAMTLTRSPCEHRGVFVCVPGCEWARTGMGVHTRWLMWFMVFDKCNVLLTCCLCDD